MKAGKVAALLVIAIVFAGLTVAHRSIFAAKGQGAVLTAIKGTVAYKTKGAADWTVASSKSSVKEGDMIKTGADSSVIIKFADGSMVKLGAMAQITLSSTGAAKSGGASLGVDSGKMWSRVRKQGADSSFSVKTPTAIAGVRGTFFSSEAEEQASTFDVFDGEVLVSSIVDPNQSVSVKSKQRTVVAGEKGPSTPSAIPEGEEKNGRNGFTEQEFTNAAFDIQVSISPQTLSPGEKATVSVQVFENNAPAQRKISLRLILSGSAVFASTKTNEIDVTTDAKGAAKLEITDPVEETVTVEARMLVKVVK